MSNYFKNHIIQYIVPLSIAAAIFASCNSSDNPSANAAPDTSKTVAAATNEDWMDLKANIRKHGLESSKILIGRLDINGYSFLLFYNYSRE